MKVGVLALQGAFSLHIEALDGLGVEATAVRTPAQLDEVAALVIPGGESTTMSMLLESADLFDPISERLADGLPVLGTCAGMILLARTVLDGRPDQRSFGALDIDVRRNAFGRQVDSFEADLDIVGIEGDPVHAVFIRAPIVERAGPSVDVLARVGDQIVLVREGPVMAASFHPELTPDRRIHQIFLASVS